MAKMVCNMIKSVIGRFWINDQQRPYYSIEDAKPGYVKIEYLATSPELGVHLKKLVVPKSSLILPKEEV